MLNGRTCGADIWQFILAHLDKADSACLMVVVESTHDTPGKPGFKMAVAEDGGLVGTVGGGALEHELIEYARTLLADGAKDTVLIHRKLQGKGSTEAGRMICGGSITVALSVLTSIHRPAIETILNCIANREPGRLCLGPAGPTFQRGTARNPTPALTQAGKADWLYEETLGSADTVYIVGGGHIGLALSRVLALLDVRIVVIDERPDVDTLLRNDSAHEKVIAPFEAAGDHIPEDERSFVVIATPAHHADECVLRQVVSKQLPYVGMMGSRTKIRKIMHHLHADGFEEAHLQRVHAPIGLPIGSHTAEEIAVSIAAEIIQVRNARPAKN